MTTDAEQAEYAAAARKTDPRNHADHEEFVHGCFRCDLSRYEVQP